MSNSVQMPALGESVTEGTVTRWLKEVGEEVEVDEPLLEVSTDKVDTEIPSPYAGTLEKILAEEDDVVEVGGDLAYIGDGSGASSDDAAPAEEPAEEPAEAPTEEAPAEEAPAAGSRGFQTCRFGFRILRRHRDHDARARRVRHRRHRDPLAQGGR
jgi:pyruvate dehydrogenase E2 component (dihydrolipoamide acetyltransferase)